ncbi:hypothetical protein REPUB_Repub17cG0192800 [Reevesia pubescens]
MGRGWLTDVKLKEEKWVAWRKMEKTSSDFGFGFSKSFNSIYDTSKYGIFQLDNGLALTLQMGDALISTGLVDLGYVCVNIVAIDEGRLKWEGHEAMQFPFLLELTTCGIGQQLAHMLLIAKDFILDLSNAHVSAVETMSNVLRTLKVSQREGKLFMPDINHLVLSTVVSCAEVNGILNVWDCDVLSLDVQLPMGKFLAWAVSLLLEL